MSGTAVVTGAAVGLGAAIAERLAHRGFRVVVADVDAVGAGRTAERIGGVAARLDVTDPDACTALAHRHDDLAVWVNNAGILAAGQSWTTDAETRRRLFDVNVHGVMNGTAAALERFRPADRGHVINVCSLAGMVPAPQETVYAATKHAALAYSVGTAFDLRLAKRRGVRISALCPDGMWTPMLFRHAQDPNAWPSWSGVMLDPADVADAAVALLDRPRLVRSLPRRRALVLRAGAAVPGAMAAVLPAVAATAKRRQRRFAAAHPVPEEGSDA